MTLGVEEDAVWMAYVQESDLDKALEWLLGVIQENLMRNMGKK